MQLPGTHAYAKKIPKKSEKRSENDRIIYYDLIYFTLFYTFVFAPLFYYAAFLYVRNNLQAISL